MKTIKLILTALLLAALGAQAQPFNTTPRSGSTTITNGTTVTSSCTAGGALFSSSNTVKCDGPMTFSATAGAGPTIAAGTATTDVQALAITQTWNNAAVSFTGMSIIPTVTANQVRSVALAIGTTGSAVTSGLGLSYYGQITQGPASKTLGIAYIAPTGQFTQVEYYINTSRVAYHLASATAYTIGGTPFNADTSIQNNGKLTISATAPTVASGGCTGGAGTVITNSNGTAYFTATVGTGCSGSQPIVFTLPAASTGWICWARNVSNAATSSPAQTGAVSTTSVTITNYVRTTGVAGAWTDSDVVVVGCHGG